LKLADIFFCSRSENLFTGAEKVMHNAEKCR